MVQSSAVLSFGQLCDADRLQARLAHSTYSAGCVTRFHPAPLELRRVCHIFSSDAVFAEHKKYGKFSTVLELFPV